MSDDTTVASKDRIRIVYRPDVSGAQEERELPMRLLVMGDFGHREGEVPIEERPLISIDKQTFEDVLGQQKLTLQLEVPNLISSQEDQHLAVTLHFGSMSDFGPDAILRQVPELRQLLEIRQSLVALKGPLANDARFRKSLQLLLEDEAQRASFLNAAEDNPPSPE